MPSSIARSRALGLLGGVLLDQAVPDPRRGHPVALYGRIAAAAEQRCWRDSRTRGTWYALGCVLPVVLAGRIAERAASRHPVTHAALTAAATWTVLGAASLAREGRAMADALDAADAPAGDAAAGDSAAGDLSTARERLPHLCGRDPSRLEAPELARATVESLAENTSDAAVASLLWGAVAGVPGLLGHRAVNTLDAMVGHRTPQHARFGTAVARADDVAAWVPARATAALAVTLAPLVGGSPGATAAVVRRDRAAHPSPNAGWCEAAWAGALAVRLGGRNVYASGVELRPTLGDGQLPTSSDIRRAARLVTAVTGAAALGSALVAAVRSGRRRGGRRAAARRR